MNVRLIHGDVYSGLYKLPNNSIDLSITSPPYWGQRDYGLNSQIGNEDNYEDYINKLLKVFDLLRHKLHSKGVFFLNIGDKYLSKYGKSPLGLIPYKLAYKMVLDGWILNDIIIWYKPNHMPSSIKNRFVNSYEPIFVLSIEMDNYYSDYKKKNKDFSTFLSINLQPTPYPHIAIYPEKLVQYLASFTNLPKNATILDPFAGSGTTLKAMMNKINDFKFIMIDNKVEYLNIIKKRCDLDNIVLENVDFIKYEYKNYKQNNQQMSFYEQEFFYNYNFNKNGIIKIFEKKNEYYSLLKWFLSGKIKSLINKSSTCYIGSKEYDIELIYKTSQLNENGWVIRNMIIIKNKSSWFPIFMIVDDNKKTNYLFNFKTLNFKSKVSTNKKFEKNEFFGYGVINNFNKIKSNGHIIDIIDYYPDNLPKYVVVKWSDNKYTKEFVINSQETIDNNLVIDKNENGLTVKEKKIITKLNNCVPYNNKIIDKKRITKENYNGKFKDLLRKNWGASPGARSSLIPEYFSLQRLYTVNQPLIADYLNYKRVILGLSKNDLVKLFPPSYQHTVGHWLRNDFGGSLPKPEDWFMLVKILNIEDEVTNYVCKTALKLQIVTNGEYKIPDDCIDIDSIYIFEKLNS